MQIPLKLLMKLNFSGLSWNKNTSDIVLKKAHKTMQLLHNVAKFSTYKKDLKCMYISFIRPILEQSTGVWHSSLSNENSNNLERVQKAAISY